MGFRGLWFFETARVMHERWLSYREHRDIVCLSMRPDVSETVGKFCDRNAIELASVLYSVSYTFVHIVIVVARGTILFVMIRRGGSIGNNGLETVSELCLF